MAYSRSNAAREKEGEGKRIDMAKEACRGDCHFLSLACMWEQESTTKSWPSRTEARWPILKQTFIPGSIYCKGPWAFPTLTSLTQPKRKPDNYREPVNSLYKKAFLRKPLHSYSGKSRFLNLVIAILLSIFKIWGLNLHFGSSFFLFDFFFLKENVSIFSDSVCKHSDNEIGTPWCWACTWCILPGQGYSHCLLWTWPWVWSLLPQNYLSKINAVKLTIVRNISL